MCRIVFILSRLTPRWSQVANWRKSYYLVALPFEPDDFYLCHHIIQYLKTRRPFTHLHFQLFYNFNIHHRNCFTMVSSSRSEGDTREGTSTVWTKARHLLSSFRCTLTDCVNPDTISGSDTKAFYSKYPPGPQSDRMLSQSSRQLFPLLTKHGALYPSSRARSRRGTDDRNTTQDASGRCFSNWWYRRR